MKKIFYGLPIVVVLSCSTHKEAWKPKQVDEAIVEIDSLDAYVDDSGRVVWLTPQPWPTYDPYTDRWEGPEAERINRVWCGHIALDTVAPLGMRKWKWTISEEEKSKMSQDDIRLGDSIINFINCE